MGLFDIVSGPPARALRPKFGQHHGVSFLPFTGRRRSMAPARKPSPAGFSPEWVLLACSLLWLPLANRRFFSTALQGREWAAPSTWLFAATLVVALLAIHYLVLALLGWGRTLKVVVSVLLIITALSAHFVDAYGVFIDPSMIRNTLHTHPGEAGELIGPQLIVPLLLGAVLPIALLWRLPLRSRPWLRALGLRLGSIVLAVLALAAAILVSYQPLASLMRNQKELRYLITPANALWSSVAVWRDASRLPAGPPAALGRDAKLGEPFAAPGRSKPALVVLVVGETARAANWGLSGYSRQTTPELAALMAETPALGSVPAASAAVAGRLPAPINFKQVSACGTDTNTSLPCMLAAVGRRDYNETRIRSTENLLHVLASAGVGVQWRDNQAGCKGLCDGFPNTTVEKLAPPGVCSLGIKGSNCWDIGLLHGLDTLLPTLKGSHILVLHQIGNHGPSYFRRVPPEFERFKPVCKKDDLHQCSTEEITNAYDNALLYTDHVLATLIKQLQAQAGAVDSAMLYVSDHGESLGEHRLFLHGVPYAIAPDVQIRVPMVLWASAGFAQARGLDMACLAQRAQQPVSHDHLFHTVLGLLDVRTTVREPAYDLTNECSPSAPVAKPAPSAAGPKP
jgi:lipid A ethanolaminephosphotransferase